MRLRVAFHVTKCTVDDAPAGQNTGVVIAACTRGVQKVRGPTKKENEF